MAELKVCRICLRTETKVYNFDVYHLKSYYEEVIGLKVNNDDPLPHYFCYECATLLHKFHKFKEKCYIGQNTLRELLWKSSILTYESVYEINRDAINLQSPLNILSGSDNIRSYTLIDKTNELINKIDDTETFTANIKEEPDTDSTDTKQIVVLVDVKNDTIKVETKPIKTGKSWKEPMRQKKIFIKKRQVRGRQRILDAINWKKQILTDEEAVKEFRSRAECIKYKRGLYKCVDCFRWFTKEMIWRRHRKLMHCESRGMECRFCHYRFDTNGALRAHMRSHFVKYHCLRCPFVTRFTSSAEMHDDFHNGIIKKCIHCGEEFKHSTTFYSHLRTVHRSEHVCTACGLSFVSGNGLIQHRKITHVFSDEQESDDSEAEVGTYCDTCDVTFDTRHAFEEHMFQSDKHIEGVEDEIKDEVSIPRKVHRNKIKQEVTRKFKRVNRDAFKFEPEKKYKGRRALPRVRRKPTTCVLCGKHFETQAACSKHHIAEHPRMPSHRPEDRHICEICGASLAPGSIHAHQNIHLKMRIYSCETCGRQFNSSTSMKRHQLIHTGQKPFACTMCDKRFTQNNSMKLHYRTAHLKEPYPKRVRRKKEPPPDKVENIESTEESNSLPDVTKHPANEARISGDSVQYLTI